MSWTKVSVLDDPFRTDGKQFRIEVEGEQRADGTWGGRVVFLDGRSRKVTGQETSQPDRKALEYWATGLEAVYLEGALARAR